MRRRCVTVIVLVVLILRANLLEAAPTQAAAILAARWTLDNTYNDSVGSANGTPYNGPVFNASAKAEGSYSLGMNGSNQYVTLPYRISSSEYTISVWIRPDAVTARNILVYTDDNGPTINWSSQIRITADGRAEHYLSDGVVPTKIIKGTTPLQVGSWNFLTISAKNDGQMKLYVNGSQEGTSVNIGTMWAAGNQFHLGSNSGHGMGFYSGLVDDIRIYSTQLSDAEVQALYTSYSAAVTYYARQTASGTGDCLSWTNACTLQTALGNSLPGVQIWVAQGVYRPSVTDRSVSFQLKSGVAVYGGFDGVDDGFSDRDWVANPTILSGDMGGDDNNADGNNINETAADIVGNNSYHVVIGATGATLDGFTITAGNANASASPDNQGGGMYNSNSSPTITHVTFSGNAAVSGGGMFNYLSGPTVTNVTFSGNAVSEYGGGVQNYQSPATFTNVTFSGNTAQGGGGVHNYESTSALTFTDATFSGNSATVAGGGMDNQQSSPKVTNATFSNNSARWGGGMDNLSNSSPMLANVTFSNNHASEDGGGMNNNDSSPTITNVTFYGNTGVTSGAGGMYNYGASNPQIRNTILWGNTPLQIVNYFGVPTVAYSVVQNGYSGTGNLSADPRLGTLGNYGGATETIPLLPGSSAINTGDDAACDDSPGPNNLDQRGAARPQGVACDIGAYEYNGYFGVYYARESASGAGDCYSWANACTLQTALDRAAYGDKIWAAEGNYYPTTADPDWRKATFQLKNGVAIYGGFSGDETELGQRHPEKYQATILRADLSAYHVVTGANGATLDGFAIMYGDATGSASPNDRGGGMYNYQSSPTVTNVTFSTNTATWGGGGMYNYQSSPTLTNVRFESNGLESNGGGGGLYNDGGSPTLTEVTFDSNQADSGGGMYNAAGDPVLINVTFDRNYADANDGGGLYIAGGDPILKNVTFSGNWANNRGGGMYIAGSGERLSLRSVTFNGNTARRLNGGGLSIQGGSAFVINSIFWGNSPDQIDSNLLNPKNSWVWTSVVQGNCPWSPWLSCSNIITGDPKLGSLGYYGGATQTIPILIGSSALDTANDSDCPATDQRGLLRPQGAHCDIGAFEYHSPTYLVKPEASGRGDCSSWGNACTWRYALTYAMEGDELWAMQGIYKPTAGTDRSAAFPLKAGVAVYGGFYGDETQRSQRHGGASILSGDIGVSGDASDNSYHVVTGVTGATLNGFTITAGNANGSLGLDTSRGGGMYNYLSSPTVTNVTFSSNSASYEGGGMYNLQSSPVLTNVTFSGNSTYNGGGMYNRESSPTLTNVTFSGNSATNCGGGIYNYLAAPTIRNTILWGNGWEICNFSSTPVVSDSVIQDGYAGGTNIITADPLLGTLGNYGGSTPTIPLLPGSSAIDVGNSTYCTIGTDQRGVGYESTCDIGAYEYQGYSGRYYVNLAGSGIKSCQSWGNACTLQFALIHAPSGSEMWVMQGTYKPTSSTTDRSAAFRIKNGWTMYGGFYGDETQSSQRHGAASILSGDLLGNDNGNVKSDEPTRSENSYHVVVGATGATLDGFTVTGGNANGSSPNDRGGGMFNNGSSPTIMNVTFRANTASVSGGGMANTASSSPTLTNVTFSSNAATWGGGMDNYSSSNPVLTNVTFHQNAATDRGDGSNNGGGMNNNASSPTLTSVTFSGNTVVNGSTSDKGGGMLNFAGSNPQIRNTILWGNTPYQIANNGSSPSVTYSVVQGGYTGAGNLSADPLLGTLGDYGGSTQTIPLQSASSAIDAGDPAYCPAADQRGQPRNDWACDIGAFEARLSDLTTVIKTVSGVGTYTFGPTLARIQVENTGGCLTGLQVQRVSGNHPNASANLQTGAYWAITPTLAASCSFVTTLTLPFAAADNTTRACRWLEGAGSGAGWDCDDGSHTTFTANAWVIRSNITDFSEWAVGNDLTPTAIHLTRITVSVDNKGGVFAILGCLLLASSVGLGLFWRKRRAG